MLPNEIRRLEAAVTAGDTLVREILEALCRRDGLPLESSVNPGEPARNYELAIRLGIGRVFGCEPVSAAEPSRAESPVPGTTGPGEAATDAAGPGSGALADDLRDRLTTALGSAWGPAAVDCAVGAVAPLVQHAAEAAAGSHEGIRLWMLDCSRIAGKHRERAEAAQAKLDAIRDLIQGTRIGAATYGGPSLTVQRILAIIGTEGKADRA